MLDRKFETVIRLILPVTRHLSIYVMFFYRAMHVVQSAVLLS